MSASHLRPQPSALADELSISAMVVALRRLSDFDLSDQRIRASIYLNSGIPSVVTYRLDTAALKVELIRRKIMYRNQKTYADGSTISP